MPKAAPILRALFGRKYDYALEPLKGDQGRGFVVVRLKDNQRLSWRTLPASKGLRSFYVAGTGHRLKALQHSSFAPGRWLALVREPDNEYDRNAIAIYNADRSRQVGYVPKDIAKTVAGAMARGRQFSCLSMWETVKGKKRADLRVLLIEKGAKIKIR